VTIKSKFYEYLKYCQARCGQLFMCAELERVT
jgi:hypothetical protein